MCVRAYARVHVYVCVRVFVCSCESVSVSVSMSVCLFVFVRAVFGVGVPVLALTTFQMGAVTSLALIWPMTLFAYAVACVSVPTTCAGMCVYERVSLTVSVFAHI